MLRSNGRRVRVIGVVLIAAVVVLGALSAAGAVTIPGFGGGSNDLGQLGPGLGQTPAKAPIVLRPSHR